MQAIFTVELTNDDYSSTHMIGIKCEDSDMIRIWYDALKYSLMIAMENKMILNSVTFEEITGEEE